MEKRGKGGEKGTSSKQNPERLRGRLSAASSQGSPPEKKGEKERYRSSNLFRGLDRKEEKGSISRPSPILLPRSDAHGSREKERKKERKREGEKKSRQPYLALHREKVDVDRGVTYLHTQKKKKKRGEGDEARLRVRPVSKGRRGREIDSRLGNPGFRFEEREKRKEEEDEGDGSRTCFEEKGKERGEETQREKRRRGHTISTRLCRPSPRKGQGGEKERGAAIPVLTFVQGRKERKKL